MNASPPHVSAIHTESAPNRSASTTKSVSPKPVLAMPTRTPPMVRTGRLRSSAVTEWAERRAAALRRRPDDVGRRAHRRLAGAGLGSRQRHHACRSASAPNWSARRVARWCDRSSGGRPLRSGAATIEAVGEWETTCVVTACEECRLLEWAVGDPAYPGATWRFTITGVVDGDRAQRSGCGSDPDAVGSTRRSTRCPTRSRGSSPTGCASIGPTCCAR